MHKKLSKPESPTGFHSWVLRHDQMLVRTHFVTLIITILITCLAVIYYGNRLFDAITEWDDTITNYIVFFILLHWYFMLFVLIVKLFGTMPKTMKERNIILIPTAISIALCWGWKGGQLLDGFFIYTNLNHFFFLSIPISVFTLLICRQKMWDWMKNQRYFQYPWFYKSITAIILTIICFWLCEYPLMGDITILPKYIPINLFYWLFLFIGLSYITHQPKIIATIEVIVAYIIGVLNYELQYFRDDYIMVPDIKAIPTAVNVAGNYTPKYGFAIVFTLIIATLTICFIWLKSPNAPQNNKSIRTKAIQSIVAWGIMISVIFIGWHTGWIYANMMGSDWDTNHSVNRNGYCAYFISSLKYSNMPKPANYNTAQIETVLAEYQTSDTSKSHKEPTIIIIQNEAWADLRLRANIETNQPIMPVLDSLTENTQKGFMTMSVDFGPTIFSEFECVTSLPMRYIPSINPFLQMLRSPTPSAATMLHNQENPYKTIFYHPYRASGYNRENAYTYMGFDQEIFYENWADKDMNGLNIVTDKQDFLDIIDIYETNKSENPDQPLFIYNVTIAGHSAYFDTTYDEMPIEITNFEACLELSNYVNHLWNTDQAIQVLIDYFADKDEDVVIAMFGDHNPHMQETATKQLIEYSRYSTNQDDLALQATYHVPYFIWANFDIEEYDGLGGDNRENPVFNHISPNYLIPHIFRISNMRSTAYYNYITYLLDKYPIITIPIAYDNTGTQMIENKETNPEFYQDLEILYWIEYNALMDSENKLWDYFEH